MDFSTDQEKDEQKQFTKENKFASGSFAKIYKTKINGVYAAAKVFKQKQSNHKIEEVAKRFFALNHENVVKLLRYYTDPDTTLIFEYCSLEVEGNEVRNLYELLSYLNQNQNFNLKQRINFVHQSSKGLNYLHHQRIVHKDFKPTNILVTGSLTNIQIKIADFDEMVSIKESIASTLSSFYPKGMTTCYIAPEIMKRAVKKASFKTDVYAWSLTSYEIMSDKYPAWKDIIFPIEYDILADALKKGERPDIDYLANLYKNTTTKEHPMFTLISQGWNDNPDNRPTSEQICDEIAKIVQQPESVSNVINNINEDVSCWVNPQNGEILNPNCIDEDDKSCHKVENAMTLMSDGGTRNKAVLDLESSFSKASMDETDEGREQLVEQKAPDAEKPIEEKKDTVAIIVDNPDQQQFVDIMLQSPLKDIVIGLGQLFDILNSGNELTTVMSICNRINLSDKDRTKIKLSLGGGGNPAKAWLEHFKANNGGVPIKDLKEAVTSCKLAFPFHFREISPVSMLSHTDIDDISEFLLPHEAWKNVAGNLLYTDIEIAKFSMVQMRPNSFNPARTLFQLIDQRFPKLTVKEFMTILQIECSSAFEYMTEQIKKWANTKVSEKLS